MVFVQSYSAITGKSLRDHISMKSTSMERSYPELHRVGDIAFLVTCYHTGWSFRRPPVAALQLVTKATAFEVDRAYLTPQAKQAVQLTSHGPHWTPSRVNSSKLVFVEKITHRLSRVPIAS